MNAVLPWSHFSLLPGHPLELFIRNMYCPPMIDFLSDTPYAFLTRKLQNIDKKLINLDKSRKNKPVLVSAHDSSILSSSSSLSISPARDERKTATEEKTSPKNNVLKIHPTLPPPNTSRWILRRLQQDTVTESLITLRHWMDDKRRSEISNDLVEEIRRMDDDAAIAAIRLLKERKRFVKGTNGQQLSLSVRITDPSTSNAQSAKALLDSGCMGSCISSEFVEKHGIPTRPTAIPIPVYNADGSLNSKGSIKAFATLRIAIGDHQEQMDMAVVHLDSADIFLGHDWLKQHNPTIDWTAGTLLFDRCPESCGHLARLLDPDQDVGDDSLEEGDRILMMDFSKWSEGLRTRTTTHEQSDAPDFIAEFPDVFSAQEFDQLPEHRPWDHAIDLTDGFKAADCKIYPLSPAEQQALQAFLDENLANGRLRQSKSPMASPFFFIKKKNTGELRPIQDYRRLNAGTIKNKYPLPLIQELLDRTKDAKFFTKLDVRWGYYNIRIKEGDEWKAAFRTNRGLFEPTVMFFGLTNAPATFQAFMNDIFKDLIDDGHVVVYLDDVLIFADSQEHHDDLVRQALAIFRRHKLFLKKEKCQFSTPYLEYLGHIIGQGELKMDGQKVAAVRDWPVPMNLKQL